MTFPFLSILRRVRPRARRPTPRQGRIRDTKYLAWVHEQPPLVLEHDPACIGRPYCYLTAHHVKEHPGSPKNDRRAVPLWRCHHQLAFGKFTVEHGREAWEERYGIDLELAIHELRQEYLAEHSLFRKIARAL